MIFWVGLVPASVLFGDIFRAFNPWRAIARAAGFVDVTRRRAAADAVRAIRSGSAAGPRRAAIFGFAWIELA